MARRFARASTVIVTAAFCACKTVTAAASVAQTTTRKAIGFEVIRARGRVCQPTTLRRASRYRASVVPAVFHDVRFTSRNSQQQPLQTQSAVNDFVATAQSRRLTDGSVNLWRLSFGS